MAKSTQVAKGSAKRSKKPSASGPRSHTVDGASAVLASIAKMPPSDREIGTRLHEIIRATAPGLEPRLWYGMPAFAMDGKVVCFFQSAQKFKTRYATLGFMHEAHLDDGAMWPTAYALTKWTTAVEARVRALVKKAVS